jgi:hypothetical protein
MTSKRQDKPVAERTAGRRLEWPTLWHRDQIPFPWGGAKRLQRKTGARLSDAPADGAAPSGGTAIAKPDAKR